MTTVYRSGEDLLFVGPESAVLLDGTADDHTGAVWDLVTRGFEPLDLLDVLAADGLARVPGFACAVGGAEQLTVVLRGRFQARVTSATGERALEAEGVATWTETRLDDIDAVTLTSAPEATDAPSLPIVHGVVPARSVSRRWRETEAAADPSVESTDQETSAADGAAEAPAPSVAPPHGDPLTDLAPPMGAPVPPPPAPPAAEPPAAPSDEPALAHDPFADTVGTGDHDGRTISAAEIARLRAERAGQFTEVPETVSAIAPAPRRAHLEISDGRRVDVDRPVYVGRAPAARQRNGIDLPRLVKVREDDVDISRTHLEIRFEGGELVATDLSTNGTLIVREGLEPRRLEPGTATVVSDGALLQLSELTTVRVVLEEPHGG